jgi:hypothetical protein
MVVMIGFKLIDWLIDFLVLDLDWEYQECLLSFAVFLCISFNFFLIDWRVSELVMA